MNDDDFDIIEQYEKETNKGGRPRKEIDFDVLERLVKLQCTGEECANFFRIDYDTLNARIKEASFDGFSDYFQKMGGDGKISLRRAQMKSAIGGNVTMQIWLGKQYLNQKDKIDQGGTVTRVNLDTSKLSNSELEALLNAKRDDDED